MAEGLREADVQKSKDAARKAAEERQKAAGEQAKKDTEAARKSSEETLAEQSAMKPDPTQEELDAIKVGAAKPEQRKEVAQPEGPAQRASEGRPDVLARQLGVEPGSGDYKTRSGGAQPQQQPKPQQPRSDDKR